MNKEFVPIKAKAKEADRPNPRVGKIRNWDYVFYKRSPMEAEAELELQAFHDIKESQLKGLKRTLDSLGCHYSYEFDLIYRFEEGQLIIESMPEIGEDHQVVQSNDIKSLNKEIRIDVTFFIHKPGKTYIKFIFQNRSFNLATPCLFSFHLSRFVSYICESRTARIAFDNIKLNNKRVLSLRTLIRNHGAKSFPFDVLRGTWLLKARISLRETIETLTFMVSIVQNNAEDVLKPLDIQDYENLLEKSQIAQKDLSLPLPNAAFNVPNITPFPNFFDTKILPLYQFSFLLSLSVPAFPSRHRRLFTYRRSRSDRTQQPGVSALNSSRNFNQMHRLWIYFNRILSAHPLLTFIVSLLAGLSIPFLSKSKK
jgi:hypothetical protein